MIPVQRQPEPPVEPGDFDFDEKVRKPGRGLLRILLGLEAATGRLKDREKVADRLGDINPEKHLIPYWQKTCLARLSTAYGGVCAYLCILIDGSTSDPTVDHFIPQSAGDWGRVLAYEWDNYRLSALPPNRQKRTTLDVLDPFDVREDDFRLEFDGCQVKPGEHLAGDRFERNDNTITTLGLNASRHVKHRQRLVGWWEAGAVTLDGLAEMAPFIHRELVLQGGSPRRRLDEPPINTGTATP